MADAPTTPPPAPAAPSSAALGSATYEIIRQRLGAHAAALRERMGKLDARRGEVYVQRLDTNPPRLAVLVDALAEGGPFAGSAAGLTDGLVVAPLWPLAEAIARAGALLLAQGTQPRPAPFYLRQADALPPADPPPLILP